MFGWIDVTGSQVTDQQLLTTKDVERQKALIIVVTVESSAYLLAVYPVIGAIKIQDQFFWWLWIFSDLGLEIQIQVGYLLPPKTETRLPSARSSRHKLVSTLRRLIVSPIFTAGV
jgi:hypothetical protein